MSIFELIRSKLQGEPPIHPIDGMMAKRWVKERLKTMYPELRADPRALEAAYQSLSLDPLEGQGEGGERLFEISLPGRLG